MNRLSMLFALCAFALPAMAYAQEPTPDPNQFTDPAMAFLAPADYHRMYVPSHNPADFDQPTIVAAWTRNPGTRSQVTITISMESFQGDARAFASSSQSELRNQVDGVFVKKNELTVLSNQMPAFWQDITIGTGFSTIKRYQYVWTDSVRGVILSITGAFGQLDEAEAKQALSKASGVLFPRGRL